MFSTIKASLPILGVAILIIAGVGGFSFYKIQDDQKALAASEARASDLQQKLDSLSAQLDKVNGDFAAAKASFDAMKAQTEKLTTDKQKAEADRKRLEDERAALEADRKKELANQLKLEEELRKTVQNKDVLISNLEGRLKVNVANQILFASGAADLLPEGQQVLDQVAKAVAAAGDEEIRVEGHTDNVKIGTRLASKYPSNWELSTARATAALRYLQSQGLPATRLSAVGFGESHPIAPNNTEENRAKNRRIEILLTPVAKP